MKNFIFKSTDADLQKILQLIEAKVDLNCKNILYITHRVDSILKNVSEMQTDKGLQKQVTDFYNPPDKEDLEL